MAHPLPDHPRFEFEQRYRHHVKVGEEIHFLNLTDRENPVLPDQVFQMFDESKASLMNYRESRASEPASPGNGSLGVET